MRKVGGTPSEIGPDRANLRASARFDLGPFARGGGAVVTDLEGRIRTHSADNRTTVFEFYDSHVGLCCSVAKRALLFGISAPTELDCVARYRYVGWLVCNLVCKRLTDQCPLTSPKRTCTRLGPTS